MKKLLKNLFLFIVFLGMLTARISDLESRCAYAYAASGIYGNGLGGIYIDINAHPYSTYAAKSNGQYAYTTVGCAWFASARAYQLTGKDSPIFSGTSWYNYQYSSYGYTRGSVCRAKALACYENHVAVVESVQGNTVIVSEGGYRSVSSSNGYTIIHSLSISELEAARGGAFLGYVYLTGYVADTTPPSISNIQVSNVSSQGYTVTCNVSDNVGVTTVKFPTWTEQDSQDDLIWHVGNVNGNVASFYVNTSEHGYGAGQYFTHIYAYDAAGNYSAGITSAFVQKMYTPISMTTYNGHIYALFDESIGWDNAKAMCESMGGHLVTITSSGEETAVQKLLTNGIRDYYFGGAYEETEGNWKWVNGDTYQYTHWCANQPDNAGGIECVLSLCKNHEGWNDITKDYPCGFILEIDKKITPAAKAYYGNSIMYEIYDKALPYPVAREYCKLKGGQLACIDTANKNTFIVNLAQNVNKHKFFFGLERASIYDEWYNANGKSQTYSNWVAGQPDAFLKLQTSACVMKDFQWDDEYCYREYIGFVKEIPISSIKVLSVKKNYKINESTKPDSMVLYAVYKDGSTRRIFSGNTVTGFSTKTPGSYKATVKYANLSTTFSYKVELPATQIIEARSSSYKAVYLKWNKVSGATGYKILMATKPSGTYQIVRTVSGGSSCSASITNLETGKTYYFKVQPYCTTGSGSVLAAVSSYKYGKPSLNKGKILSTQFAGEGKVRITWSRVSGAYGYEIFRATSKNGTYRKHSTANGGSVTTKTISTGDKKYYYRIRAYRMINGKKVYGALSDSF